MIAIALLFGAGVSHAVASGAVVVNDTLCVVPDRQGNLVVVENSHSVVTTNKNNTTLLTCNGTVAVTDTQKGAVRWNAESLGLPCGTLGGLTTSWHAVITPQGNATLVCQLNPSAN